MYILILIETATQTIRSIVWQSDLNIFHVLVNIIKKSIHLVLQKTDHLLKDMVFHQV